MYEDAFAPQNFEEVVGMRVVCAWCGVVLSEAQTGVVSHGICASCSIAVERAFFMSRVRAKHMHPRRLGPQSPGATLPLPGFPR